MGPIEGAAVVDAEGRDEVGGSIEVADARVCGEGKDCVGVEETAKCDEEVGGVGEEECNEVNGDGVVVGRGCVEDVNRDRVLNVEERDEEDSGRGVVLGMCRKVVNCVGIIEKVDGTEVVDVEGCGEVLDGEAEGCGEES